MIVSAILHTDPACHDRLVTQVWGHYYGRQDLFQYVEQLTRTEEEEEEDIEDMVGQNVLEQPTPSRL